MKNKESVNTLITEKTSRADSNDNTPMKDESTRKTKPSLAGTPVVGCVEVTP